MVWDSGADGAGEGSHTGPLLSELLMAWGLVGSVGSSSRRPEVGKVFEFPLAQLDPACCATILGSQCVFEDSPGLSFFRHPLV